MRVMVDLNYLTYEGDSSEIRIWNFKTGVTMKFKIILMLLLTTTLSFSTDLPRMKYNNPGLVVDLGVGLWAWPIPMDYDNDGDNDLLVSCPDKPYNGVYFFENKDGDSKFPVFEPGVKIA